MFIEFLSFLLGKIFFFCGSVVGDCFPKTLSSEEEKKYLIEFKQNGDNNAKEMLIKHNLRLVAHIVKKYQGSEDTDDLISTGTIGLIKAINTYDIDKGTQLATYTARCIENEILMLLRANKKHQNNVYLSDTISSDKDGNELTIIDMLSIDGEEVVDEVSKKTNKIKLNQILKDCLTEREYTVISLRFGLKNGVSIPQRDVAKLLKISRSYISRIEKKSIEKIKTEIQRKKINFN